MGYINHVLMYWKFSRYVCDAVNQYIK